MTLTGSAALFSNGAPAAPAPAPGSQPLGRIDQRPAQAPSSAPGISDPAPHDRRMARIQFCRGSESRRILH